MADLLSDAWGMSLLHSLIIPVDVPGHPAASTASALHRSLLNDDQLKGAI
jgi:hypothetical protein